ncbi:hypothetical protein CAK95_01380 [Pseudorhodoplanes sinuspersici]|uniref:Uncharacterized protein n=1 Tax=Pseudorhodoplanes sinuspersici TaxID=1235591 RepID=A0A1W6ZKL5_9HYPH|nr:hypothetical protein CAK95_01380 [Pseudorhodoplanes sinuspersici]
MSDGTHRLLVGDVAARLHRTKSKRGERRPIASYFLRGRDFEAKLEQFAVNAWRSRKADSRWISARNSASI